VAARSIAYFHEHIMPYRQTVLSEVNNLHAVLSSITPSIAPSFDNKKAASIAATKQSRARVQEIKGDDVISPVSHVFGSKL